MYVYIYINITITKNGLNNQNTSLLSLFQGNVCFQFYKFSWIKHSSITKKYPKYTYSHGFLEDTPKKPFLSLQVGAFQKATKKKKHVFPFGFGKPAGCDSTQHDSTMDPQRWRWITISSSSSLRWYWRPLVAASISFNTLGIQSYSQMMIIVGSITILRRWLDPYRGYITVTSTTCWCCNSDKRTINIKWKIGVYAHPVFVNVISMLVPQAGLVPVWTWRFNSTAYKAFQHFTAQCTCIISKHVKKSIVSVPKILVETERERAS